MAKTFKRYYTGQQNGKDDWRREKQISEQEFADRWEHTFGILIKEEADVEEVVCRHVST